MEGADVARMVTWRRKDLRTRRLRDQPSLIHFQMLPSHSPTCTTCSNPSHKLSGLRGKITPQPYINVSCLSPLLRANAYSNGSRSWSATHSYKGPLYKRVTPGEADRDKSIRLCARGKAFERLSR